MSKRASNFPRRAQDAYDTPASAVRPLLPHLPEPLRYWEPCAGSGRLIEAIPGCIVASDIEPRGQAYLEHFIQQFDALEQQAPQHATHIITNPPWSRPILHPMICHFSAMRPSWLLFDADWMHTKQAAPLLEWCRKIVSVGRVSWMENGTSGFDNCAWYLFDQQTSGTTEFVGRLHG